MAVDSALTPPLSAEAKQLKKDAKKAAKLLRRAAEAQSKADEAAAEATEEVVAVVGEKRKAGEDGEVKKVKKSKKNKDVAVEPTASTSTIPIVAATPAQVTTFLEENRIQHEPETAASSYPAVLSFAALPIEAGLRTGLAGYTTPTPIQCASFPVTMGGRDVIGIAETGSGKTVAFGVPAIQHILSLAGTTSKRSSKAPVSVLVVAPTRELAMQTHANLLAISSALPAISSICIYGGVSKDDQKKALKEGPRIVVGTPGRLLDLAGEGVLNLSNVSWLVLDEADRMLDRGFENDIREIIKQCLPLPSTPLGPITAAGLTEAPTSRMTCMFSATWPVSVRKLASDFMCQPVRITVGADELTANSRVEQTAVVLQDGREKEQRLLGVLRDHGFTKGGVKKGGGVGLDREKVLVFALYKKEAERVSQFLDRQGFEVGCIQGDMSQDKRTKSLLDFKEGKVQILVATDVAARGLDIPKVELVVNQTFPLTIEDYIHRIGRTGRAGRKGKSVTFFTEADKAHAGELIRVLKDGGHEVPEGMYQWGTTIKKVTHSTYGAHYRDDIKGVAKKIKFD